MQPLLQPNLFYTCRVTVCRPVLCSTTVLCHASLATKCTELVLVVVCPLLKWPGGLSQQRPRYKHDTTDKQQDSEETAVTHVQKNENNPIKHAPCRMQNAECRMQPEYHKWHFTPALCDLHLWCPLNNLIASLNYLGHHSFESFKFLKSNILHILWQYCLFVHRSARSHVCTSAFPSHNRSF